MLTHIKIFTKFALRYLFNLGVNHKIYTLTNAYSVVFPISYYTVISKCRNFGRATLSLFSTKIKFFTFYATLSKKFSSREQQYLDANGNSTTRSQCNYSLSKSFCKKINDNIFVVVKNFLTFVLPNLSSKVNHRFCKNIKRISVVFLNPYSFAVGRFGDLEKATLSLYLKVKIFYDAKPSRKLHTREQEYLVCNGNSTTRSTCNHFSVFRLFFPGVPGLLRCHEPQSYPHHYRQTRHRNAYPVFLRQEKSLLRAWQQLRKSLPRAYHQYAYAYGSSINLKIHTKL